MNKPQHLACMTALCALLSACTDKDINHALGTPKNLSPVLVPPPAPGKDVQGRERALKDTDPFVSANFEILRSALQAMPSPAPLKPKRADAPAKSAEKSDQAQPAKEDESPADAKAQTAEQSASEQEPAIDDRTMREYLSAGFALTDIYCERFFRKADESQRRRKFGRAFTNDVGTVMTTILGLANAGENIVTGSQAIFGFGDSLWRNYDDAFVISPELATVRTLVLAKQDNFRERTLGKTVPLPTTYSGAQSVILRYADSCSYLGMKALLDQSAIQQRSDLDSQTSGLRNPAVKQTQDTSGAATEDSGTTEMKGGTGKKTPTAPKLPASQPTSTPTPIPSPPRALEAAPLTASPALTPS